MIFINGILLTLRLLNLLVELNIYEGNLFMIRLVALLIMVIPGVFAAYGVKLMRDMVFGILHAPLPYLWLQFLIGLLMVIFGVGFIAGFILHRDRKRNKVQSRFQKVEK
jgi:hypothetical protein